MSAAAVLIFYVIVVAYSEWCNSFPSADGKQLQENESKPHSADDVMGKSPSGIYKEAQSCSDSQIKQLSAETQ